MTKTELSPEVAVALDKFIEVVQADQQKYYQTRFPSLNVPAISLEFGSKFIRVVLTDIGSNHSSRVFCFIEKATGNVLKSATYKAPAKGVRGNILAHDPSKYGVNTYGANYFQPGRRAASPVHSQPELPLNRHED